MNTRAHLPVPALLAAALLLCGCPSEPVYDGDLATLSVVPGTVTLATGGSHPLSVLATDVDGNEVTPAVTWVSADPAVASVDDDGVLVASASVGSTTLVAEAGGLRSAPVFVAVVEPVPGTVFVLDSQIVGDFALVDPGETVEPGSLYEVTLTGVEGLEDDAVILGQESIPLAGRVVGTTTAGSDVRVTLELLPIDELFAALRVDEELALGDAPVAVPAMADEHYAMSRDADGNYVFAARDEDAGPFAPEGRDSTFTMGPFSCTTELPTFPIVLNTLPTSFTVTPGLSFVIDYDSANGGLQKLAVRGEPKATFKITPTLTAAFEGKISCQIELAVITIPIGGPLALFFGGQVPVGAGVEVGGKITLAQVGAEVSSEVSAVAEIGLQCPGGSDCSMLNTFTSQAKADYVWVLPQAANLDAQLRIEPSANGHLFAKVALGSNLWSALRFDTFLVKGGVTQAANLSTVVAQVADPGYSSDYALSLDLSAGLAAEAEQLFDFLNVNVAALELKFTQPLFQSPKAISAVADVDTFEAGDPVDFTVQLDPSTLDYLFLVEPVPYNVDEVVIHRKTSGDDPTVVTEEVARVAAAPGQTEFALSWTATSDGAISDGFHAFVDTRALAVPLTGGQVGLPFIDELEVAKVAGASEGTNSVTLVGASTRNECELETYDVVGSLIANQSDSSLVSFGEGDVVPPSLTSSCSLGVGGVPRGVVNSTAMAQGIAGALSATASIQGSAGLSVRGDETQGADLAFVDGEVVSTHTFLVQLAEPHSFTLTTQAQGAGFSGVPYDPDEPEDYHFVQWDLTAIASIAGQGAVSNSPVEAEDVPQIVGELGPGAHTLIVELEWDPEANSTDRPWGAQTSGSASASLVLTPIAPPP